MRVFLGGTVNGSKWRDVVKEKLIIDYFDPVVDDWNDAAYERELSERRFCNYLLYVITPKMTGFYAIAEVTDDSYHRPDRTIYCYLPEDEEDKFSPQMIEELERLGEVALENGAVWLKNLDEVVDFLNSASAESNYERGAHYDAYISYGKQESQEFSHRILNRLNENNLNVYMDREDIPLMIENEEFVYSTILASDNFIYVISPNSVRSELCKKELDFALRYNKRVIPVVHHDLGSDAPLMDSIIAKKKAIEISNPEENISEVVKAIDEVINTDKDYVQQHSHFLFKAREWDFNGRRQSDLLYGKERQNAVNWLKQSSDSLSPLQLHQEYIKASKKISVFMLPLLWLNEKTRKFTHLKGFDQAAMLISLISPVAMAFQIPELIGATPQEVASISLPMWFLFLGIQITLSFVGIKTKDLRLFISMVLSLLVSSTVISLVLITKYA